MSTKKNNKVKFFQKRYSHSTFFGSHCIPLFSDDHCISLFSGDHCISLFSGDHCISLFSGNHCIPLFSGDHCISLFSGNHCIFKVHGTPAVSGDKIRSHVSSTNNSSYPHLAFIKCRLSFEKYYFVIVHNKLLKPNNNILLIVNCDDLSICFGEKYIKIVLET